MTQMTGPPEANMGHLVQLGKIIGRVAVDDCAFCPVDKGLWAEESMGADIPLISANLTAYPRVGVASPEEGPSFHNSL